MLVELAVFHPGSVAIAERCGVDRIELCTNYTQGGLSPDIEFFSSARKGFSNPVFVMIRPRPGNFEYSREEILWMKEAIKRYSAAGADGFVLGCLKGKAVDEASLDFLVNSAAGKPVTFHRAIDEVADYHAGMKELINSGCSRLLSTGQAVTAAEGAENIARIIAEYGKQIKFLAGGGIRSSSVNLLSSISGLEEIHTAAITTKGEVADEEELNKIIWMWRKKSSVTGAAGQ